MVPPLPQLLIKPHEHLGVLVPEDLRGLSDAGTGLQEVRCDGMPVQVRDEVATQIELLADAAKAATDRATAACTITRPGGTRRPAKSCW